MQHAGGLYLSTQNPADLASRGVSPVDLLPSQLWWGWPAMAVSVPQPLASATVTRHVATPPRHPSRFRVTTHPSSCLWSFYSDLKNHSLVDQICRELQGLSGQSLSTPHCQNWRELLLSEVDKLSEGKSLPSSSPLLPIAGPSILMGPRVCYKSKVKCTIDII